MDHGGGGGAGSNDLAAKFENSMVRDSSAEDNLSSVGHLGKDYSQAAQNLMNEFSSGGGQQYEQTGSEEEFDSDEDDDEENCIEIDERTLIAIIKVQALIRGFLTRKMIFEHLQRMVAEN